jgi:hypothetical protein
MPQYVVLAQMGLYAELDIKQQFTKETYSSTDRLGKNVLKWLRLGLDS